MCLAWQNNLAMTFWVAPHRCAGHPSLASPPFVLWKISVLAKQTTAYFVGEVKRTCLHKSKKKLDVNTHPGLSLMSLIQVTEHHCFVRYSHLQNHAHDEMCCLSFILRFYSCKCIFKFGTSRHVGQGLRPQTVQIRLKNKNSVFYFNFMSVRTWHL